jgi:CheY-like chemotaxis protein
MPSRRILVIDDHPTNRRLVALLLEPYPFEVVQACSGAEGLAVLEKSHIDAVLLDISMPDMNGVEVLSRIRSNPASSHLRVVAYTAHALDSQRQELLDAGFSSVLTKPISSKSLLAALQIS